MRKKLFATLGLLLTVGIGLIGYVGIQHYYLFPNSHTLFRWQHQYLPHLAIHTQQWHYDPGDSLLVYASRHRSAQVSFRLMEALTETEIKTWDQVVDFQNVPERPAVEGTNWKPSLRVKIPSTLASGWYLLQAADGRRTRTTSLFIRPQHNRSRLALLLSTNTWNAYNYWGGQSVYTAQNPAPIVSFSRPQPLADPFIKDTWANHQLYFQAANKDLPLYRLLDSVGLRPDVYAIEALHTDPGWLSDYAGFIISTHSEYWSAAMLDHLNTLLDRGTSLINLAGNVAAYRIYLDIGQQRMEIHRTYDQLWESQDTMHLRPFGTQPDFLGFHTYAPYQVEVDSSWVLAGTGLGKDSLIGRQSTTYDYTYMYESWWQNLLNLGNQSKLGAAAGLELDNLYPGTPQNWTTIARGLNAPIEGHGEVWPDPSVQWEAAGPPLGYYEHPGGGIVFGVGSISFTGSIPLDPGIRQIIVNVARKAIIQADTHE